jgi:hypothetical protein
MIRFHIHISTLWREISALFSTTGNLVLRTTCAWALAGAEPITRSRPQRDRIYELAAHTMENICCRACRRLTSAAIRNYAPAGSASTAANQSPTPQLARQRHTYGLGEARTTNIQGQQTICGRGSRGRLVEKAINSDQEEAGCQEATGGRRTMLY